MDNNLDRKVTEGVPEPEKYFSHVYEYHIQRIKIDKVSGSFQIGQMIEGELLNREGLHRIFVNDILVHQIEGSGSMGIGYTKKGKKKKKKKDKIPPEQASQEIKMRYEDIKNILNLNDVPLFFQKLAVKKSILNAVSEQMKEQWKSSKAFHEFYEEFKKEILNNQFKFSTYELIINQDICQAIDSEIEDQAKTLLVILYFLQLLIPGYVEQHFKSEIEIFKNEAVPSTTEKPKEILKAIKTLYNLEQLPKGITQLKQYPSILKFIYKEVRKTPDIEQAKFINSIKEFMLKQKEQFIFVSTSNFKPDNQAFFFSLLLNQFNEIPFYILIEEIIKQLCKENS